MFHTNYANFNHEFYELTNFSNLECSYVGVLQISKIRKLVKFVVIIPFMLSKIKNAQNSTRFTPKFQSNFKKITSQPPFLKTQNTLLLSMD